MPRAPAAATRPLCVFALAEDDPGAGRANADGRARADAEVETLKREYGFDLPPHLRYFKWMANLLRGDLGRSFFYNRPVLELLAERLPLSLLVSLLALLFTYLVSIRSASTPPPTSTRCGTTR